MIIMNRSFVDECLTLQFPFHVCPEAAWLGVRPFISTAPNIEDVGDRVARLACVFRRYVIILCFFVSLFVDVLKLISRAAEFGFVQTSKFHFFSFYFFFFSFSLGWVAHNAQLLNACLFVRLFCLCLCFVCIDSAAPGSRHRR